jgi:hypothetical protein
MGEMDVEDEKRQEIGYYDSDCLEGIDLHECGNAKEKTH